jgi:hypothetical protein
MEQGLANKDLERFRNRIEGFRERAPFGKAGSTQGKRS